MILIDLFLTFMLIGIMTYGGGYSILPLVENLAVNEKEWLDMSELADIISISEMSPGPFSLNCSTFVGMKTAGLPGAVTATFGFLLPPILITLLLAYLYKKYNNLSVVKNIFSVLNACIIAILIYSAVNLLRSSVFDGDFTGGDIDYIGLGIFLLSFVMIHFRKISPIIIMIIAAVLGILLYPII